jgi:SAM-dependent methyltransferase
MNPAIRRRPASANGRRAGAASLLVAALALAWTCCAQGQTAKSAESAAPYVPTPWVIVDEIMKLGGVGAGDYVVDLGSGDGRLVIAATKRYGARGGFGVDIDESLVRLANETAAREGVGDRVAFYVRDLFVTAVGDASVVTLYLLPTSVPKLEAKLLRELRPGARVVSHDYPFPAWPHDRMVTMEVPEKIAISGTSYTALYLYTVPAQVGGEWQLVLPATVAPSPVALSVVQQGARASGRVQIGERSVPLGEMTLKGENVTIALPAVDPEGRTLTLHGKVSGDRMDGTTDSGALWHATRRAR